jgi:uncharacterized protein GlcG (DUF336 family)
MNNLSLAAAERILDAAIAKAVELGVPSSITVLDSGAHPVAFLRQETAPLISIDSSSAKARTAIYFKTATSDLVGAVQPGAALYTLGDATPDRLTFIGGGIPLFSEQGDVIGAIGSGGGSPEQDATIATAGAAAL